MSVVTEYIDNLNAVEKSIFSRLRELVHEIIPDVEETRSYGMPTYKYKGKYLFAFASHKNFMSIYPGGEIPTMLKDEVKHHFTGKGTLSFTAGDQLSEETLKTIIQLSKESIEHRLKK